MRIVMTPSGSLGDLHPYLGVAVGLRNRGHEVTIATSGMYRDRVEGEGIAFYPVRPDLATLYREGDAMRRALDWSSGTEYLMREVLLPHLEESCADLLQGCRGKDLVVSHTLALGAPVVAENLGIPWISVALQPLIFFSMHDPPVLAEAEETDGRRRVAQWERVLMLSMLKRRTREWMRPVDELRCRLGLAESPGHPLFEGKFSPLGTLAWFSPLLAFPQPDWPARTKITGFPFYDRPAPGQSVDPRLEDFLDRREPPVVFTLGSSTVLDAGDFFEVSAAAARRIGCRAILLTGARAQVAVQELPETIFVAGYAPYSGLIPRCAAIVHQGGIGTTAHALLAGRPMLVVPHGNDQPDNAERVAGLGVARVVNRKSYTPERAKSELERLLSDCGCSARAAEIAHAIRAEDGVSAACDALEAAGPGR